MGTFDPAEMQKMIDNLMADPGVLADVDQRQAALDNRRDTGTWWACLALLATQRGNDVAHAVALQNLKQYLAQADHEDLLILTSYLLHNTVHLVANQYENGDIPAAIAGIVGGDAMFIFEKFVATSGASCPDCGHDEGWVKHECRSPEVGDESLEG